MSAVLERLKTQTTFQINQLEKVKTSGEPKTVRWTQNQYFQMAELGFFGDKRVELIKGEIIEMSPMKSAHATALSLAIEVLRNIFGEGFIIRAQLPMNFGKVDAPEPDVAVIKGSIRDYSESHPKIAELIIEISDTTLNFDRTKKASLYAENKVSDYWILNLKHRCLEIYRRPIKDRKLGFIYTEIKIFTESDEVSPLAAPAAKIKVADILP